MDVTTTSVSGQLVPFMDDYDDNNTMSQSAYKFLSDEVSLILNILFDLLLSGLIGIIGIIANVINIIVFIKQGAYKECGSVNLLGLAISDFCVVTTMFYTSVIDTIGFLKPLDLPWVPFDFRFMTGAMPHLMFAQITRAITAYVSFERCVCVVLPFKVKTMLTPTRSIVILMGLSLCVILNYAYVLSLSPLKFKFDPLTNTSRLMRVPITTLDVGYMYDIMWYLNSVAFNLGSVAIVIVCTLITVSRVKLSKTWRKSMATGGGSTENTTISKSTNAKTKNSTRTKSTHIASTKKTTMSNALHAKTQNSTQTKSITPKRNSKIEKEKTLIKMIISISVIFLVCYLPDLAFLLMHTINRDISTLGKYRNLAQAMYSITFFMETFNSSINILVYYRMSSRYKLIFKQMIGISQELYT